MKEHVGICTSGQWGIEVPHVTSKKIVSRNGIVIELSLVESACTTTDNILVM
jgi:hypothetical protein